MRRDSGIGLGLLVLCGTLFWQTGHIGMPPFVPIGPAFYPRIILVLLAALALWLIGEDLATGSRSRAARSMPAGPKANYRLVALCFAAFGAYVIGLSLLGYLASTFLFVLGLGWVMGPRRYEDLSRLAITAAGTTAVTYLVFERYLHVFLPRGLLF